MTVIKIATPGTDVKDARLADEVIDSAYPSPKVNTIATPPHAGIVHIDWQSTTPIPYNTLRIIHSFPHGYNYVPTTLGALEFDNGSTQIKGVLPFQYGSLGIIGIDADATNVNIYYLSLDLGSTAITPFIMRVRFYVMAERGIIT